MSYGTHWNLLELIKWQWSLVPTTISSDTTTNGTGIDRTGKKGMICIASIPAYTDGTYTMGIEESEDDTTYTDITGASWTAVSADPGATNNLYIGTIDLTKNIEQYVRFSVVSTGTTTGATVMCLFGFADVASPVTQLVSGNTFAI